MAIIKVFGQLHNANIGEYVTTTCDVFDPTYQQTQFELNQRITKSLSTLQTCNGVQVRITSSTTLMQPQQKIVLSCTLSDAQTDYTADVKQWTITRGYNDAQWSSSKTFTSNTITIDNDDMLSDTTTFYVMATTETDTYGCSFDLTRDYTYFVVDIDEPLRIPYHDMVLDDVTLEFDINVRYNDVMIVPKSIKILNYPSACKVDGNHIVMSFKQSTQLLDAFVDMLVEFEYNGFEKTLYHRERIELAKLTCYHIVPCQYEVKFDGTFHPQVFTADVISSFDDEIMKNKGDYMLCFTIDDGDEVKYSDGGIDLEEYRPKDNILFSIYHQGVLLDKCYVNVDGPSQYVIKTNLASINPQSGDFLTAQRQMMLNNGLVNTSYGKLYYTKDNELKMEYNGAIDVSDVNYNVTFYFYDIDNRTELARKVVPYYVEDDDDNSIEIDDQMSTSSANPVANSVITKEYNKLLARIIALESK